MSNTAMTHASQTFMAGMTPKFAVSYLRVSTRGQAERGGGNDEGFSIPAQREANKKKALSMGAIIGKICRPTTATGYARVCTRKCRPY